MSENDLEEVREKLNKMILRDDASQEEILKLSQKLDMLIVTLMMRKYKDTRFSEYAYLQTYNDEEEIHKI